MPCTTTSTLLTRAALIGAGQTGTITLRAEDGEPVEVRRLLLSANGTGEAGLAGLVLVSARVGKAYLVGGPVVAGLRGAASTEVHAEALVRLFSRYALQDPVALAPGEDLVLTFRNDAGAARRVVVADDRGGVLYTVALAARDAVAGLGAANAGAAKAGASDLRFAPSGFAASPSGAVLTATFSVPASAAEHRVEVPRELVAGYVDAFAFATAHPLDLRVALVAGRRTAAEPAYTEMLERMQDRAPGMVPRVELAAREALEVVVTNDAAAVRTLSFVCEFVSAAPYGPPYGTPYGAPLAAPGRADLLQEFTTR